MLQKVTIILSAIVFIIVCGSHDNSTIKLQPIVIVPQVRIFFGPPSPTTSKFPPIIELLVQRLQTQFSTYVYEDLSRPPTYEKPVYTLTPEEEATATEPLIFTETTTAKSTKFSEETVTETNVIHPIEYGTLVVYLKKNTTVKSGDDGKIEKTTPLLTALLDVKITIPGNYTKS